MNGMITYLRGVRFRERKDKGKLGSLWKNGVFPLLLNLGVMRIKEALGVVVADHTQTGSGCPHAEA